MKRNLINLQKNTAPGKMPLLGFLSGFFLLLVFVVPQLEAAFKTEGWGARAMGMGSSFVSVSDDSHSILYNPAGTVQVDQIELAATYTRYFEGLDLGETTLSNQLIAAVVPMPKRGSLGFAWGTDRASNLYKEEIFAANYSQNLNKIWDRLPFELLVGANVKLLRTNFELDSRTKNDPVFRSGSGASAVGIDMGVLVNYERNSVGMVLRNLNSPDIGLAESDKVAKEMVFGVSRYYYNWSFFEEIYPSLDISYRDEIDSDYEVRVGGEGWMLDHRLALRLGMLHSRAFTMGAGYRSLPTPRNFQMGVDYAFVLPLTIEGSAGTHRLSLSIAFGSARSDAWEPASQSEEFLRSKMQKDWQCYVDLVKSGGSQSSRLRFLRKFVRKYRYSQFDIQFAVEEYETLKKEVEAQKKSEKINSILKGESSSL